ncbi:ThuA domain-containing protein [Sphingobacterium mizutaii]|uniref:ThuA domain-containing protein n=1 Tax=Sphingobacterium mizutaii TaxID=1010 RepID=UPI0028B058D8|nr:ThuA domain-containing protein [Sphingobacterium mizutaii]
MKRICVLTLICCLSICFAFATGIEKPKKVLVFTKTAGFRHDNIEEGVKVLTKLLKDENIGMFHTEDANIFLADSLKNFDAVLFFSTTGTILDEEQKVAFQNFLKSGKGFMGIHAATDTEHDWPWYNNLVGAYFASHPAVQEAKIDVKNRKHLATKHLPKVWMHKDEWYDFSNVKPDLKILMTLDEKSYKNGKMGDFHPIAWYQKYDGIKVFYTGLGHTKESFYEPNFQKQIIGGLKYVLGY